MRVSEGFDVFEKHTLLRNVLGSCGRRFLNFLSISKGEKCFLFSRGSLVSRVFVCFCSVRCEGFLVFLKALKGFHVP